MLLRPWLTLPTRSRPALATRLCYRYTPRSTGRQELVVGASILSWWLGRVFCLAFAALAASQPANVLVQLSFAPYCIAAADVLHRKFSPLVSAHTIPTLPADRRGEEAHLCATDGGTRCMWARRMWSISPLLSCRRGGYRLSSLATGCAPPCIAEWSQAPLSRVSQGPRRCGARQLRARALVG